MCYVPGVPGERGRKGGRVREGGSVRERGLETDRVGQRRREFKRNNMLYGTAVGFDDIML